MKSLSTKLTLWYAIATTVTAAVFVGVGRYALEHSFIAGIDLLIDAEFEEVLPRLEAFSAGASRMEVEQAVREHTEIDAAMFFFEIDPGGGGASFLSGNLGGRRLSGGEGDRYTLNAPDLGVIRVGHYWVNGFHVWLASSLQNFRVLDSNLMQIAVLMLLAVFASSLAVGYALSRYALSPIATMQRMASRITAHNLNERIDLKGGKDEVARLGAFLNEMFDRLQASFQQVQRFTADASHELKTPLSLIRLNAEALLADRHRLSPDQHDLVEAQLDEVERLNRVTNDLLILSKADAGALLMNFEMHEVQACLEEFAVDARTLCEHQGLHFELVNNARATVPFDSVWIRHLLFNLLSNSLKVAPSSSVIRLTSIEDPHYWHLTLEDEGPGVPAEQIERIFDRFFRGNAVAPDSKGSGLGLALCKSIVQQHEGVIDAANRADRSGLRISIRLPRCLPGGVR